MRRARVRLAQNQLLRVTLERQGLARRSSSLDVAAAVERFGPLHATDHRTPYLSLLARLDGFARAELDRAWLHERLLDRRVAMRGTLHLVPRSRLADIVCAFGSVPPGEHRVLRAVGITADEVQRFRGAMEAILAREGPLDLAALKRALPEHLRKRAMTKTVLGSVLAVVLRILVEAGALALVPNTDRRSGTPLSGWVRAPQRHALFADVFGPLPPCDRDGADARLASWYFEAHGPAAFEDWAWWAGVSLARARAAFEAVRGGLAEIEVAGWPDRLWLPSAAVERDVPHRPVEDAEDGRAVRVLPYEDAGIKAYRATRRRFFDDEVGRRQLTGYGEVLPAVLLDGRVIGRWSHGAGGWTGARGAAAGRQGSGLSVELYVGVDRTVRQRLDEELDRVRRFIDAAYERRLD